VGGGVDVGARSGLSSMAPHPPLRLIAVGPTSAHRGLDVIVRAVAKARGRGTDARLLIVGSSTNLAEWTYRAGLESLVASLALTSSVRIDHAMTPRCTADMLQRAHVLVDAGTDDGLSRSVLEAMAGERIVISSSNAVAPMLDHASPLPLTFSAGDPVQLAERLVGLAAAWPTSLQNIASGLRVAVEAEHSIDQWADRVLGAMCAIGGVRP
jgi:glycosyltransferase involved in cell wall biosynthesis